MKVVIVGGTGLIGSKLAPLLRSRGHEVLQASPSKGVNAAPLADFVGRWLRKHGDTSRIVLGADVPYFGAPLALRTLVPDDGARIMPTRFDDLLGRPAA
jgi:nucleoside-diphosphate-sugar epimerase